VGYRGGVQPRKPHLAHTPLAIPSFIVVQVLEATKELITEGNFEVSSSGLTLQAMDSSHVSLVALSLRSDGFEHFRADRSFSMGMNLNNMVGCGGGLPAAVLHGLHAFLLHVCAGKCD
jgi:hypothetical protein